MGAQEHRELASSSSSASSWSASLTLSLCAQRVNCISPGYMATALTRVILDRDPVLRDAWSASPTSPAYSSPRPDANYRLKSQSPSPLKVDLATPKTSRVRPLTISVPQVNGRLTRLPPSRLLPLLLRSFAPPFLPSFPSCRRRRLPGLGRFRLYDRRRPPRRRRLHLQCVLARRRRRESAPG